MCHTIILYNIMKRGTHHSKKTKERMRANNTANHNPMYEKNILQTLKKK